MASPGEIVILSNNRTEGLWLYTHIGGSYTLETAKKSVKEGRRNDPSYLTRTVICNLIADSVESPSSSARGFDLLDDDGCTWSQKRIKDELIEAFTRETGFGVGHSGGGGEFPTVIIDADTGEVWTDDTLPTTVSEIAAPTGEVWTDPDRPDPSLDEPF